jgi:type 1 fimbria pilin
MRIMVRCALLLMAMGICFGQATPPAHNNKMSFSIKISSPQKVVKVGSPILLVVKITNISDRDISHATAPGHSMPEFTCDIEVRDSRGSVASETPYGLKVRGKDASYHHGGSMLLQTLKPGEELQQETVLSRIYDMTQAGKYTIQVSKRDPDTGVTVKSNTTAVTVQN